MANIKNILQENEALRAENEDLKLQNDFLQRKLDVLMIELQSIKDMSMFEFANEFCTAKQLDDAEKAFAQELLGRA